MRSAPNTFFASCLQSQSCACSLCPTFAAIGAFINNARWDGVPFLLKAGKALHSKRAEIRVQFRHVPGNLYRDKLGIDTDRATNELVGQSKIASIFFCYATIVRYYQLCIHLKYHLPLPLDLHTRSKSCVFEHVFFSAVRGIEQCCMFVSCQRSCRLRLSYVSYLPASCPSKSHMSC